MKEWSEQIPLGGLAKQYHRFQSNLQVPIPAESTYEQYGNYLHSEIFCYLEQELDIDLVEFFRVAVKDNAKSFFMSKKPDYSICTRNERTEIERRKDPTNPCIFLPLFVSKFKKGPHENSKNQLLYSSPLPTPYLNLFKIYSTL